MKSIIASSMLALASASFANIATFEDLSLDPGTYENGANLSGSFTSSGLGFNNTYDATFDSWAGFSYSNIQDGSTSGFGNQYAAKPGAGHSENNYAIAFEDSFTPVTPTISVPGGQSIAGVFVSNTTYTYFSMLDGDFFAKKFGGTSGNDADWFKLTAIGFDGTNVTGTADFYLADFRDANNTNDYIVSDWRYFDLSGLGSATTIKFSMSSSDNGMFGMNTPAYFALDDVAAVPEPASLAILGVGAFALIRRRGGRRSN